MLDPSRQVPIGLSSAGPQPVWAVLDLNRRVLCELGSAGPQLPEGKHMPKPDVMSDLMPDKMPEPLPERTPDYMPDRTPPSLLLCLHVFRADMTHFKLVDS